MNGDRQCSDCGVDFHLFTWMCPYDLHGKANPFKTGCATCGETIPSGGERAGDDYGNLYCSAECKAEGLQTLLSEVADVSGGDAAA